MEGTNNTAATEPSMQDIGRMLAPEKAEVRITPTSQPEAVEPKPEVEAAEPATEQQQPETTEPEEEPLPPGIRKKIDQEIARTLEIRKAISERKAAQHELDKLTAKTTERTGPEPVAPAKPVRPNLAKFEGTLEEYETALEKYETEREQWVMTETERKSEERWTAKQREADNQRRISEAQAKHGVKLQEARQMLSQSTPEGLQLAISEMDNWADVAVHLVGNPEALASVQKAFAQSPFRAAAELGRIEDRLKQAATQQTEGGEPPAGAGKPVKALPNPPSRVGGGGGTMPAAVDMDKASTSTAMKELHRIFGKKSA